MFNKSMSSKAYDHDSRPKASKDIVEHYPPTVFTVFYQHNLQAIL